MSRIEKVLETFKNNPFYVERSVYGSRYYIFNFKEDVITFQLLFPKNKNRTVKWYCNNTEEINSTPSWFQEVYYLAIKLDEQVYGLKRVVSSEEIKKDSLGWLKEHNLVREIAKNMRTQGIK